MGLTKRADGYYVAFRVITSEDSKTLRLASGVPSARLKRWKVGTLNMTAARDMEAAIKTNLLLGKVLTEDAKHMLFGEWAKQYLQLEEVKGLRTYRDRVERVMGQLVPFFGRKIVSEIRPQDIEIYRAKRLRKDGEPASLQTVNNDHTALKHCLNVAVRRGLLVSNPAARVPMPNPQNERDRVLSEEEWARLYQASKPHLRPILLLAYQLGQRFTEIIELTWERVDLRRGFILLRAADTKTKTRREIPLTPGVRATLQQLAKVWRLETSRVFLYKGKPIQRISRAFKSALKGAGLQDFRFHDLRHCASTNLRRAGVDTATAMKIIGHKSEKMWKRYNAIEERDLTQAAAKLDKYLQSTADTVMTLADSSAAQ